MNFGPGTNPFVASALQQVGLAPAVEAHIDQALDDILAETTPLQDDEKCPNCRGTGRKSDVEWSDESLPCIYPADPTPEEVKEMARSRYDYEQAKTADYIAQLKKELMGE